MYDWRKMTPREREQTLKERKQRGLPWHSLPHFVGPTDYYHLCAACYEHKGIIGFSVRRLTEFNQTLLDLLKELQTDIFAWCILPNHYHLLFKSENLQGLLKEIGLLHGRMSFNWNGEENSRGRKIWCNTIDRWIRNERHFSTALNYIHHNPVKHGLVNKWQDWPFSSASDYLKKVGVEKAQEVWYEFPIRNYEGGWLNSRL